MGCKFCEIATGEAPASVVYRDEYAMVIMDIFPVRPGHALVIPLNHGTYIADFEAPVRSHLLEVANGLMAAQKGAGIASDAANLLVNDGPAAGQSVPHVHIHLIPRKRGDLAKTVLSLVTRYRHYFRPRAARKELDEMALRIAGHMPQRVESPIWR